METQHLFETVDVTTEVNERLRGLEPVADELIASIASEKRPLPKLLPACRGCDHFDERCLGRGHRHTVLELPSLHHKKLRQLLDAGVVSLSDLPDEFALTDRQARVREVARTQKTFVGEGLESALESIQWPCRYLDFETVATVLPLYEGLGCHYQALTQFSVHHRGRPAAPLKHVDYLADAAKIDERALAIRLIEALGDNGSILVYSSFEKTRISALKAAVPAMSEAFDRILARLVDLHAVISTHVYHPGFRGSYSIKRVLPSLLPDFSYDDMPIADGDTAITRFARMARGEITGAEAAVTRRQLLEYCRMDTLAMVRLHDALVSLSAATTAREQNVPRC